MQRLLAHFRHAAWLNPVAEQYWDYTPSLQMMRTCCNSACFRSRWKVWTAPCAA
jgi:uncharacterized protein with von Willebrand factor type A (vWA) domain